MQMHEAEKAPNPAGAALVETVLRAVYGRGTTTVERVYEIEMQNPSAGLVEVLGTHTANPTVTDVAAIADSGGGKKVKVTGSFDLFLWCKGVNDTYVTRKTLHFVEDIPVKGLAGASYKNEEAAARFVEHPVCGKATVISRGSSHTIKIPVTLTLAGEVVGDARVLVYARPLNPEKSPKHQVPDSPSWFQPEGGDDD
ncbi:MAG: outer spore coat protein CotE [Limnochordales bacterium]|nr:outer spore coat protein CotE [Limnochordales bacterium]